MSTLSKCTSWLVCLPSVCLIAVSVCLSFVCRSLSDRCLEVYMLICLPFIFCMSVILSFVCLTTSWHLSVHQHQSVCLSACHLFVCLLSVCHLSVICCPCISMCLSLWLSGCLSDWVSPVTYFFPHLTFFTLFTLNQPLVFRSSLIVQPSLLALCIFCVFVSNTYHSPCFNCIASRTVTSELCSHPRILKIILGLCWAAPTVLLPGVCGIFPPLLPQDGTAEHTLPFLFSFPLTYSGFGVPNTFHIR